MTAYPTLLSPTTIGNVELRNRLVFSAHARRLQRDGIDSAREAAYAVERARGGCGLVVNGNRAVHPTASVGARIAWACLRDAIASDRRLTDAVRAEGGRTFVNLNHFGVHSVSEGADDLRVLWSASPTRSPFYGERARQMTRADMDELVDWWARSAEHSAEGGFDGIELQLCHSYLLNQFLSPLYNRRTDEYGGSLENRLRLPLEVVAAVRERVGPDVVVGARVSANDFVPGGLVEDDLVEVARRLAADGRLDYLSVTAAGYHSIAMMIQPSDWPAGDAYLAEASARVKAVVGDLPVMVVGGIRTAALAEGILAAGQADLVAMTRAQIADPELGAKLAAGREDELTRCIYCNQGCLSRVLRNQAVGCTVNPAAGRERLFGYGTLRPSAAPGRWVVVGGGPAGARAATVLARRGHRVTLLEREAQLGGQLRVLLASPGREPFARLLEDQARDLELAGVDVRLGSEATVESVRALTPDGVVVATGAVPDRSGVSTYTPGLDLLPGAGLPHVRTAWDVVAGWRPDGRRVVVLDDDGGRTVAAAAELLLDAGCDVELVTRYNALFPNLATQLELGPVYARVLSKGLRDRQNAWATSIEERGVVVLNVFTGVSTRLEDVDAVVLATGSLADDRLAHELAAALPNVHAIGDCVAPRKLDHAVYEGELAGRELWTTEERTIWEGQLDDWEPVAAPV